MATFRSHAPSVSSTSFAELATKGVAAQGLRSAMVFNAAHRTLGSTVGGEGSIPAPNEHTLDAYCYSTSEL